MSSDAQPASALAEPTSRSCHRRSSSVTPRVFVPQLSCSRLARALRFVAVLCLCSLDASEGGVFSGGSPSHAGKEIRSANPVDSFRLSGNRRFPSPPEKTPPPEAACVRRMEAHACSQRMVRVDHADARSAYWPPSAAPVSAAAPAWSPSWRARRAFARRWRS
jgi:hypothetical protein